MALESAVEIAPPKGKLGILLPGMGAVGTTFIAGVLAIRRGLASPIGSLTQMGTIRIGKRTDDNVQPIKDYVPLADLRADYRLACRLFDCGQGARAELIALGVFERGRSGAEQKE